MTIVLKPSILLTYGTLTLAIVSLWIPQGTRSTFILHWTWLFLLLIAMAWGLFFGFLQPVALIPFSLMLLAAYTSARQTADFRLIVFSKMTLLILVMTLSLHVLPGIANPKIISGLKLSEDALPYDKYFNFDSALIGLCLIGFGHSRLSSLKEWTQTLVRMILVTVTTLLTVMLLSLLLGYVEWQPKSTSLFWIWAWGNLFFTCVAEEAFFRGFIQKNLINLFQNYRSGSLIGLLTASCLFGLAHYTGGHKYIFLATVAGIGYGWAYLHTQRIEAAILTHFSLNALHFVLFTYPALASAV